MKRRFSALIVMFSAVCGIASSAELARGVLVGKMEGNVYISPTGEFKIPSPILSELGGSITDTENVVTFSDSFDTHVSIACFGFDATQRWEFETRTRRDYLLYFFTDFVLQDFKQRFPGSRIESARYLPDLHGGTLITFALLPGGSNFENQNKVLTDTGDKVVAKRGTLLMVRGRHLYIISTELAERATRRSSYQLTVEEENLRLSERLINLVKQIEFLSPEEPTR